MKGLSASALGMVKKADTNNDPRYTAVGFDGKTVWAIHPKHFNTSELQDIEQHYRSNGVDMLVDTELFVRSVDVKGFVTHSDTTNITREYAPIFLESNILSNITPATYSTQLENGDADTYAGWKLSYHPYVNSTEIDITQLPNIDLNSSGSITVKHADGSVSYPLPFLLQQSPENRKIKLTKKDNHLNGFWYTLEFGGRELTGRYSGIYQHKAIVDGKTEYLIQNANREAAFMNSALINGTTSALGNISSGDGFSSSVNVLGGLGSVVTAFNSVGLHNASLDDRERRSSNIGGDITKDAIGEQVDMLLDINYPTKNYTQLHDGTTVEGGQFSANEVRQYPINTRFTDMNSALSYIQNQYPGKIVSMDAEPVYQYGEYTEIFKRLISIGALL